MKFKELTIKTDADLSKMLSERREALRLFRFGAAGAKNKNEKNSREIRKDIARIMTALNAKAPGKAGSTGATKNA